jgi:hypothetical protein
VLLFYTSSPTPLLPCCRVAVLPPSFETFYSWKFRFYFIFCYKTFKLQVATWQLATRQHLMGYMVIYVLFYILFNWQQKWQQIKRKKERKKESTL